MDTPQRSAATLEVALGAMVMVVVEAVLLGVVAVMITLAGAASPACNGGSATTPGNGGHAVSFTSVDATANAQTIVLTTAKLGLSQRAAVIAVATAMDESSLIVVDHGDVAGPDSRGLFQQRDSWGSLAQRMDPATSTTLFLERMVAVPNWQSRSVTDVAHNVQVNQDPNTYARFEAPATDMVNRFWPAGTPAGGSGPSVELAANTTAAAGGSAGGAGCPGTGGQTKVITTTYPVPGGGTQPVEISTPLGAGPGTPPRPAIVMVHGGGFFFGDHTELGDAAKARIALLGDSAGGTLVTEAALTGDHTGVQAVVSWSMRMTSCPCSPRPRPAVATATRSWRRWPTRRSIWGAHPWCAPTCTGTPPPPCP